MRISFVVFSGEHSSVIDLFHLTRPDVPYGDDIHVWAIHTKPVKQAYLARKGFLLLAGGLSPRRLRNKILETLKASPSRH